MAKIRKTTDELLADLRHAVGRAHGIDLGDVGGWFGADELFHAGFWDGQAGQARSFAAVADAAGVRLTWWEETGLEVAA